MSVTIANTELTNSFNSWRLNTNHIATVISNNVVTVSRAGDAERGGYVTGNGHVHGTFSANVLRTPTIEGGNTSVASGLTIASNTTFDVTTITINANTTLSGNVTVDTSGSETFTMGDTSRLRVTGGTVGQYLRKASGNKLDWETLTLRQLGTLTADSSHVTLSAANTSFAEDTNSPHLVFTGGFGNVDDVHLYLAGDSTVGDSDLYVQLADASGDSKFVIADSSNTVVATIDSDGNVTNAGNNAISGKLTVGTTLTVAGATALNGGLNMDSGKFTVADTSGNIHTEGTLDVKGKTTIAALHANGNIDTDGTLTVDSNATVGGTITVTGAATFSNTISARGDVTLYEDLAVSGNTAIADRLDVTGNTNISGTLDVTGKTNLNNTTDSSSKTTGSLVVDGGVGIAKKLYVGTNASVGGTLTVTNSTTLNGDVTLGDASTDTITVKGNFANISVDGTATFNGAMNINGSLNLGDAAADSLTIKSTTTVENGAAFQGSVDIGNSNTDTLTVLSEVDSDFTPSSTNTRSLGKKLKHWEHTWTNKANTETVYVGNVLMVNTHSVDSAYAAEINGRLLVRDQIHANSNLVVHGNLTVDGQTTIASGQAFSADEGAFTTLSVTGTTTLGDTATDVLYTNARVANNFIATGRRNLGDSTTNWHQVYANTILRGTTVLFGTSGKLHANNTISDDTILNAMLKNPSVTLTADGGTNQTLDLGETFDIEGGEGIDTVVGATNKITISGEDATSSNKGIAKFDSGDFSVSSGNVTLKNATTGAVLAINGTSNEVNVSRTNGTVTVGLPDSVSITDDLSVGGQLSVSQNVVVSGNLIVSGTTTTVNTETINLADNIIVLNSNHTGTPSQDAGIAVNRGSSNTANFVWDESDDTWSFGHGTGIHGAGVVKANRWVNYYAGSMNIINAGPTSGTLTIQGASANNSVAGRNGGDVQIVSGLGSAETGTGGDGGDIHITANDGGQYRGSGGAINISSGGAGGYGSGGAINITAGNAYGSNQPGSDITITAGSGRGSGDPGNIIFKTYLYTSSGNGSQTLKDSLTISPEGVTIEGNAWFNAALYIDKNSQNDTFIYFHDESSNTNRSFGWDDSENAFIVEDESNTYRTVFHSGTTITSTNLGSGSVGTTQLAADSVTNAKIAADAVTGSEIADDSIDSEHYVNGSIDAVHLASNSVTNAKLADDAVTSAELKDVVTFKILNSSGTALVTLYGAGS
jgi:hypothetical protein